ncbi:MAG TPA: nicotinate-nucleotide adenylyltransferase [Dehalococcoidia bacterium]|nr:nicotinate-nucleotide adenylyltransferase [Dehalococcoidia bacterium]
MRLGFLGGTFDPPHVGHLILAEVAREQLGLSKVLFIPAGDPWRKADREVSPAQHRLAMTRLAIEGNEAFEVDDCEIKREGATYTVDTLRELRARLQPDDEIVFLAGEDALADMPRWKDPAGIAAAARLAIAPRSDADLPEGLPFDTKQLLRVDMPYVDISSTGLRERARKGLSLRYQVPPAVDAYIRENGLYSSSR